MNEQHWRLKLRISCYSSNLEYIWDALKLSFSFPWSHTSHRRYFVIVCELFLQIHVVKWHPVAKAQTCWSTSQPIHTTVPYAINQIICNVYMQCIRIPHPYIDIQHCLFNDCGITSSCEPHLLSVYCMHCIISVTDQPGGKRDSLWWRRGQGFYKRHNTRFGRLRVSQNLNPALVYIKQSGMIHIHAACSHYHTDLYVMKG